MLIVHKLLPNGAGLAPVLLRRAATLELDWDTRQKSRFDATASDGRHVGVFLPRGSVVRGGDALVAEDGTLLRVLAAPQPVLVVRACAAHGSPFDLVRAAYHLGNRHVPLELRPDHLKLEPDHVLAQMLRQMHLIVEEAQAAFEPEAGAYASAGGGHQHGHARHAAPGHAHAHSHDHPADPSQDRAGERVPGHDHEHDHHGHGHDHGHAPGHVHGPGCGHSH